MFLGTCSEANVLISAFLFVITVEVCATLCKRIAIMASEIYSEWLNKFSDFTHDVIDNLKMRTFQFNPLIVDPCKKFLCHKNNLLETIPSVAQQLLVEKSWLLEDMQSNKISDNFCLTGTQNPIWLPNIITPSEERLLSSNIIQTLLSSTSKSSSISYNSCEKNWLNIELDLKEEFIADTISRSSTLDVKSVVTMPLMKDLQSTTKNIQLKSDTKSTVKMEVNIKKSPKPSACIDINEKLKLKKTRALAKQSKKRRKRQKRKLQTSHNNKVESKTPLKETVEEEVDGPCSSSSDSSHMSGQKLRNSEIMCVSFDEFKSGLQLAFCDPVVATSDDDSDWEVCSYDQSVIEAEFEFSGMFVTSFTSFCELDNFLGLGYDSAHKIFPNSNETSAAIRNVNKLWREANEDTNMKPKLPSKVSFVPDNELVKTIYIDYCERKGEWEQLATERLRFKKRIEDTERILSPCLSECHRLKILKQNKIAAL